jgi:transaldolase
MTIEGLRAVPNLEQDKNVRVNVTMVFSSTQAYLAMKAGPSYITIVLRGLDACGIESDIPVTNAVTVKANYGFQSEIIAGSLKTQNHILSCLRAGVDIATIPKPLFFELFNHPLTDLALVQFAKDWERVPK